MKRTLYARGPFVCFCVVCDAEFMGSVVATHCEECAAQGIEARQGGDGTAPREARKPDPKGCAQND